MAQLSECEKFHQQIFDQLEDLKEREKDGIVARFVKAGERYGVDVVAEILDKGKSVEEVFAAMNQKNSK